MNLSEGMKGKENMENESQKREEKNSNGKKDFKLIKKPYDDSQRRR